MSEAERLVERLRELLAKATPGPWKWDGYRVSEVEPIYRDIISACGGHIYSEYTADPPELVISEDDAALIVEAVNALPTLLARIAALEDALLAIEAMETNWALGIDGGMENARRAARKALGNGSE